MKASNYRVTLNHNITWDASIDFHGERRIVKVQILPDTEVDESDLVVIIEATGEVVGIRRDQLLRPSA